MGWLCWMPFQRSACRGNPAERTWESSAMCGTPSLFIGIQTPVRPHRPPARCPNPSVPCIGSWACLEMEQLAGPCDGVLPSFLYPAPYRRHFQRVPPSEGGRLITSRVLHSVRWTCSLHSGGSLRVVP